MSNNNDNPAGSSGSFRINSMLAGMMFLQYMLVAVFFPQLSSYLKKMNVDGYYTSLILSSMAIGSMLSPVIGALADRYFPAQRVLSVANILTAIFLALAATADGPFKLFVFTLLAMICYMPTWSLTSSIAMTHAKPEIFPRIRMFGTIGWVASGLFSIVAINLCNVPAFDSTKLPLYCGAAIAVVAAISNIFLPNTPPGRKDTPFSPSEVLGLKAFSLLRDKNYLVFFTCIFFATIPFTLYFNYGATFLDDYGFTYKTVTMNWGQCAEMFFLFVTTTLMTRLGIKKAILLGLLALTLRYGAFWLAAKQDVTGLFYAGILFHGLIFGLLFVGGQVYTDKKSPAGLRSQSQGMLAFSIWGIAILLANFIIIKLIDFYTTTSTQIVKDTLDRVVVQKVDWIPLFEIATYASIGAFVFFLLFFREEKEPALQ
ncbi:MAG: MFS transporter [Puniceicoccales bacterium]|jgi:nucleoside transporter|nr:MFS transporter [Puniceicoccales bacterium]